MAPTTGSADQDVGRSSATLYVTQHMVDALAGLAERKSDDMEIEHLTVLGCEAPAVGHWARVYDVRLTCLGHTVCGVRT